MTHSMPRGPLCRVMLGLCLGVFALQCNAQVRFGWPGAAKAAVSLSYDDALESQLDHAVPALNRYGMKATFYLTLGSDVVHRRMRDWQRVASEGHELGNHTLFHQCSAKGPGRAWVQAHNDLDRMDRDQLLAQIRLGNTLLYAIDGKTQRSFTVPCGDLKAQGAEYVDFLQADFVAVKSTVGPLPTDMASLNPFDVKVLAPANVTGAQLIDWVKRAAAHGTMANITFHGVGGDYLSVSQQAHDELLSYLATERATYWVDTFLAIMVHAKQQQAMLRETAQPKAAGSSLNEPHPPQTPVHVGH